MQPASTNLVNKQFGLKTTKLLVMNQTKFRNLKHENTERTSIRNLVETQTIWLQITGFVLDIINTLVGFFAS